MGVSVSEENGAGGAVSCGGSRSYQEVCLRCELARRFFRDVLRRVLCARGRA